MNKFEFTEEKIEVVGVTLHRIRALVAFGNVEAGELGGFIAKIENLSMSGEAWVSGDAWVYGNARVYGNAEVSGEARVYGNAEVSDEARVYGDARVYGNARVYGDARVYGNAEVSGEARVYGDARVYGNADYIVFKNFWSSGRWFTWTRSNNMWRVGCFYGTGEELVKRAYQDSERSGREYERVVKYVQSILDDERKEAGNE